VNNSIVVIWEAGDGEAGLPSASRRDEGIAAAGVAVAVSMLTVVSLFLPAKTVAQQLPAAEPTAVTVEVSNGTTGRPGAADRVVLQELTSVRQILARAENVTGTVNLPTAPVHPNREYLVTVYRDGVPYFARASGFDLQQEPVEVYVFDATESLTGVAIEGMNLVVRRQGSLFDLEYLLTVTNENRPQKTVRPAPHTIELAWPAAASNLRVELTRGPEPEELAVEARGGRIHLPAPLPPGSSRLRLTADLPLADETEIPVGANLPVRSWSVLTMPPTLRVLGRGLEPAESDFDDVARTVGPPLTADQEYRLILAVGAEAEAATELFADSPPAEEVGATTEETAEAETGGLSATAIVVPLAVIVLALYLWQRKRRTE
jgi:hypothetical protein